MRTTKKPILLLLLLLLSAFSLAARSQPDFQTIRDGIEHAQFIRRLETNDKDRLPVALVNALRVDLSKVRLDIVHAMDAAIGVERTSSIARRYGAVAAVNAGFFRIENNIFKGDSAGVLSVDGKILSESYADRIALGIFNDKQKTQIRFARIRFLGNLDFGKNQKIEIKGVNRQRDDQEDLVIFTPQFHRTTLTNPNGLEIVVKNNKISEIRDKRESSPIPSDGFVISATGKFRDDFKFARINQKVKLNLSLVSAENGVSPVLPAIEDATGGVPQLIKNGKIEITWEAEKFTKSSVETRHPRTAAAKLKNGKFLLVTVDGRSESSGGMSLPQLAEMLLEMGAVEAINLDGGGSTTMYLDGKIVNRPSDKEGERPVSDAILIFPRRQL